MFSQIGGARCQSQPTTSLFVYLMITVRLCTIVNVILDHFLLLLSDTLERCAIFFNVHKSSGVCISLDPLSSRRILYLTAASHGSIAMPISFWRICCHSYLYLKGSLH